MLTFPNDFLYCKQQDTYCLISIYTFFSEFLTLTEEISAAPLFDKNKITAKANNNNLVAAR